MADSQRKTANLFDKTAEYAADTKTYNYTISGLEPNKYYTCSTNFARISGVDTASLYFGGGSSASNGVWSDTPRTFKSNSSGEILLFIRFSEDAGAPAIYNDVMAGTIWVMLNVGSTPLPYEPYGWLHSLRKLTTATDTITTLPAVLYADGTNATVGLQGNMQQTGTPTPQNPVMPQGCGDLETTGEHTGQYKIPISNGGVTTNIYLGSTQTVRQIKKLVLTGQEDWRELDRSGGYRFVIDIQSALQSDTTVGAKSYCTHLRLVGTGQTYAQNNAYTISGTSELLTTIGNTERLADWKQFLADQYANGTPVTVWYVLRTPETATVNEPLMKIGTYADTLSNATAIPTTEGANSISVDTTVQPSEFTATWTGWHDASVKEWDGSDWQ